MKLRTIFTEYFKLDGGAMFGVVPRTLWDRLNPPDDKNLCTWAMRCLLIETDERKILIDTGIGRKQDPKFYSFFEPHGGQEVADRFKDTHPSREEITDVFLTHLHFDHVGGAVIKDPISGVHEPAFPNARYWTCKSHFDWAYTPNEREKASYLRENFVPLREHGVLHFIDEKQDIEWLPGIRVRFVYGHTEAMMIPIIETDKGTIVYCADLLPSSFHVRIPYIMAYDVRPLVTLEEKTAFFEDVLNHDWVLFLEHDPSTECIRLAKNDRGRIEVRERFTLDDFIGGSNS